MLKRLLQRVKHEGPTGAPITQGATVPSARSESASRAGVSERAPTLSALKFQISFCKVSPALPGSAEIYESIPSLSEESSRASALVQTLTDTEVRFLRSVIEGKSQRMIASELRVTEGEVEELKASLMRKLGAEATADVVRIGLYAGL